MIYNVIYSCDDSWIVSSLQSSVSRDSSEIMIDADLVLKKHLLLLSVLKKLCCLIFFCVENKIPFMGSWIQS